MDVANHLSRRRSAPRCIFDMCRIKFKCLSKKWSGKMISPNFVVAVVTVVLRGLLDRILSAVHAPVYKTPFLPSPTGIVLISGTLYLLYYRLIQGRRIPLRYSPPLSRRTKIIDGRIHKNGSQSSISSLRERRSWSTPRFRSRRSRSRCRQNLLAATKDSLDILRNESSVTSSSSSKDTSSIECGCGHDISIEKTSTRQRSPSVYCVKRPAEAVKKNPDKARAGELQGIGDCDWVQRRLHAAKRRKRVTRKTRSGKIYSSYV